MQLESSHCFSVGWAKVFLYANFTYRISLFYYCQTICRLNGQAVFSDNQIVCWTGDFHVRNKRFGLFFCHHAFCCQATGKDTEVAFLIVAQGTVSVKPTNRNALVLVLPMP